MLHETYDALEAECCARIRGLESQLELMSGHRDNVIRMNRIAKTALDVFEDVLNKPKLRKQDVEFIVERIDVYTDHIDVQLKSDIDALLRAGQEESAAAKAQTLVGRVYHHKPDERAVNRVSSGEACVIIRPSPVRVGTGWHGLNVLLNIQAFLIDRKAAHGGLLHKAGGDIQSAFLRAVVSILLEATAFHVILNAPAVICSRAPMLALISSSSAVISASSSSRRRLSSCSSMTFFSRFIIF